MMGAIRLEESTVRRAHRAGVVLFLTALLISLGMRSAHVSLGLFAGYALATLVLLSWQFIVKHALAPRAREISPGAPGENPQPDARPGAPSPRLRALAVGLGLAKLPILGAIVYVLVGRQAVSPEGFAVGFIIPQLAVALLAIGRAGAIKEERRAAPRRSG